MHAAEKKVRAFVRVKPTAHFAQDVIKFGPDNKSIDIYIKKDAKKGVVNNKQTDWSFRLDGVLHNTSQELTYETVAKKLVSEALTGYNGTIMCYGQTGAGKTYTMTGATAEYKHRGIIPRAVQQGETNRVIAEHSLNKNSSRSHCIFTIYIETRVRVLSDIRCINSKINLIDLAGSERLSKTGSEGRVLKEAAYINKSLSFLEQIIIALADPKREHIPFRQSKLTHVLKDALGGKCNTVLVANICGEALHVEETLSSLRFATRMKWITTEPVVNVTYDSEGTVKTLEKEISLLKQELAMHDSLVNRSLVTYGPLTDVQVAEIKSQIHKYLQGTIDEIDIMNFRQVQEVFRQFKLIVRQQEGEVETRLRSKYVLIDKNDFAAIAAAQKLGIVDVDHHLLKRRDVETRPTPVSPKPDEKKKKFRTSSEQFKKEGTKSFFSGRDQAAHLPSKSQVVIPTKNLDVKEKARNEDTAKNDAQPSKPVSEEISQRPSSPPSRAVAFEQFKEECGSEINRIFKENKSILLARRKRSSTVARRINTIKQEMEDIKKALEAQRQERSQQGEYVDEKGRLIIDEKEFLLIMKLKDLKEEYRCSYAELQDLKAEIQYCQHLVDRCRNKLISEFEIWYSESFLIPTYVQNALKPSGNIRPGMIPINRVMCLEEDEQERFERMQEAMLPAGPDSVSFYKAKMKTDQKHAYNRAMSSLKLMHKKPGHITAAGKDRALPFLHVT
ncbi:kinesin-like protein KIF9 isoform X3 [Lagopus muta]|uniref:kinesin-like protein KIF9 isoform X3 n=1 Tax=Lagopus muta TaxID=64668 RepID=UPI0020A01557|nr:kinesin-like protein KIF9 isoform X3 [Lagopus muta]